MKTNETKRQSYPTDLTDKQWDEIEPLFVGMRQYKHSKKELLNAMLYLVESGCKWRQLPNDFPPFQTVYSFFRRAKTSGLWDRLLEHMVRLTRRNAGKSESPSYAIVDSQSVKTTGASEQRGIDGGKKRKDGSVIS
jgi:putative transposase